MATYQRVKINRIYILCVLILLCVRLPETFGDVGHQAIQGNPHDAADGKKTILGQGKHVPVQAQVVHHDTNVNQMEQPHITTSLNLAESEQCREDVIKTCSESKKENFPVMECLQDRISQNAKAVSVACQTLMWHYKLNLTKDPRIERNAWHVCDKTMKKNCAGVNAKHGLILSCLIEHKNEIEDDEICRNFVDRILTIVFQDYRFMKLYFDKCEGDVKKLNCGRHATGVEEYTIHNEGNTIECLTSPGNKEQLTPECHAELLKVAELQADDYHMDRPLYYACKSTRDTLCSDATAGGGAVYTCLMKRVNDPKMPPKCRDLLLRRQKMIEDDVKVDEEFYKACESDIATYQCDKSHDDPKATLHRSDVMFCLEEKHKAGKVISATCQEHMGVEREEIIENPEVNDNFAQACKAEIDYCTKHNTDLEGTKLIHCIMDLVEKRPKHGPIAISPHCKKEVKKILEEVDLADNYKMDSSLQTACKGDVVQFCKEEDKTSDTQVLGCLMANAVSKKMSPLCHKYLSQIQYFIVRDYSLNDELRRKCHTHAVSICNAPATWKEPTKDAEDDKDMFVLPCLYRHKKQLDATCKEEVKKLMHERAVSVDMMPEIEEPCMHDLSNKCSDKIEKGEEVQCLEDKLATLEPGCKKAIESFIEAEDGDIEMDQGLMKACLPAVKKFCQQKMEEAEDEDDTEELMLCMIEHKHHPDMPPKCAAQITHHELINMQDIKFSHHFKESCETSIKELCKGKVKKYDVIVCLSEIVRDDVMNDKHHRLPKKCRKQLKVELLERSTDIDLDPVLKQNCGEDLKKYCSDVSPGPGAIIACLKKHQHALSPNCMGMLFSREIQDAALNVLDVAVTAACQNMIKVYCHGEEGDDVLSCLKEHKDGEHFDKKCRAVLVQREINENQDYRLNPDLRSVCRADIKKFCSDITSHQTNDKALDGKVINCLKKHYIKKKLSDDCANHVGEIVKESALDFREDASLVEQCHTEITKHCGNELEDPENVDELGKPLHTGGVEDCLKQNFEKIKNVGCKKEVARLMAEGRADVHADPHLYDACHRIISKHCAGVPPGYGRVMVCLIDLLEDKRLPTGKCLTALNNRKHMWEYASKFLPPDGFGDLISQMHESESRYYFLGIIITVIGIILIGGVMCGRVTKRVRADVKNR